MNRVLASGVVACLTVAGSAAAQEQQLRVRISWGHTASAPAETHVQVSGRAGLVVEAVAAHGLERGDSANADVVRGRSGAGDVDAIDVALRFPAEAPDRTQNVHVQWTELIGAADAASALRLLEDPAFTPGAPSLTVQLDQTGTRGFTVTTPQLLAHEALWIPSLDVYLTRADAPVTFDAHRRALESHPGQRVLDEVRTAPEATLASFIDEWEDMGAPTYVNPHQVGPGHIVGLAWDSGIHKFGIDRAGGVWPDYGNPDRFRYWFGFADLSRGVAGRWQSQRLRDGLPVVTTSYEQDGIRYEIEQFAYPLNGPPAERQGDVPMVLLQRLTLTELDGRARTLPISMSHTRRLPPYFESTIEMERRTGVVHFRDRGRLDVLLSVEGTVDDTRWTGTADFQREQKRIDATVLVDLPARGTQTLVAKLPSPTVEADDVATLDALDYEQARATTLKFWSDLVARGAQFTVPEQVVNDLFRANLWHALRLPRRHGGTGPDIDIDLPYSNFAYSQTGTPWPVNQAVYVDYMLYDLRGYHAISAEELRAQFRNNQEISGHVNGYANWLVYTPAMLYAVAQNYLLSNDTAAFEQLLPQATRALDWCLARLEEAASAPGPGQGLVRGPLNDNTGDGMWAFNQAYLFAGLDLFGRALERHGDARASEVRAAASRLREAIERAFGAATMRSPVVPLRDGTWSPYVPAEALTRGRLLREWYPTDIDTGATHLLRLGALPAGGVLGDALLHDHEDNLYYKTLGMAQEPIYNQQATAYLRRDEPQAVIRAFYSYIASAFSHTMLEPVEHRWGQGQYFGPPSTDGAWFELYRNMLLHERDDDVLLVAQATPRAWLRDGQRIEVRRAPTYYGQVSATIESRSATNEIQAEVQFEGTRRPSELHVRLRHPDGGRMRSVTVNGAPWSAFDPAGEWVRIDAPSASSYVVVARY